MNFSSLVGLKAELLRKQAEVNQAKLKTESVPTIPKVRKKSKRPKSEETKEKTLEMPEVDVNAHKKSKLMLEAKARLYDRLKKSKNNHENFLVDFTNKSDESEEENRSEDDLHDEEFDDNDDDWVTYIDCFGRTRKCLQEDLPFMQEKDRMIEQQVMKRKNDVPKVKERVEPPVIEEKEPEIEIMRRKWEEQTQKLADKANIHYQDILFDEARAHGVGYYAFSQDEEERIKQQENLAKLRMDTERKQKEMKELKELKDKMEQNRLKAARIRQRIRAGLPAEPTEEELAKEREAAEKSSSMQLEEMDKTEDPAPAAEKPSKEEEKEDGNANKSEDLLVNKEDKVRALGELLGKRTTWHKMSQEEWVEKYRNIRVGEFAPAYSNFRPRGYLASENRDTESTEKDNKQRRSSIDSSGEKWDHYNPCYEIPMPPTPSAASSNEKIVGGVNKNRTETAAPFVESTSAKDSEKNTLSGNTTKHPMNRSIDEESIIAGLRYLREKFEERQNT